MGITGLIPFLDKSSRAASVKEYAGCTVAVDAYCWLHKGAFSCADRLVMKEPTTLYVSYCMKFVNMLLSHNIKPILVFDGQNLPAKRHTEKKRRENREINRRKGQELLRAGRVSEGRSFLRRALDVTHEMALEVMKECRRQNVDCIVAPYEADAQLAYLNIQDIAQLVITEDSDLLLFGCKAVLFKMDHNGNGLLVESTTIPKSMGIRNEAFSLEKFRLMCILSGCDYIDSLPGVGLAKACKFVNRTSQSDISMALSKLSANLGMKSLVVTDEYRQGVLAADLTFRCQLVFDPLRRLQVPLSEPKEHEGVVGELKDPDTAYQLALGNLDPKTLMKVDDYDPGASSKKPLSRMEEAIRASHKSIWSGSFTRTTKLKEEIPVIFRSSTLGKKQEIFVCPPGPAEKRCIVYDADPYRDDAELLALYGRSKRHQGESDSGKPKESMLTSRYFKSSSSPSPESVSRSPGSSNSNSFCSDADETLIHTVSSISSPLANVSAVLVDKLSENNDTDSGVDSGYSCVSDDAKGASEVLEDSLPSSFVDNLEAKVTIESQNLIPLKKTVEDLPASNSGACLNVNPFTPLSKKSATAGLFTGENALSFSKKSLDTVGTKESAYFNPTGFSYFTKTPVQPKQPTTSTLCKTPGRARVGLSRPKKSSQSLLTKFGFQTKPKIIHVEDSSETT